MEPLGEENTTIDGDTVRTQRTSSFFEAFSRRIMKNSADAYELASYMRPPEQPNLAFGSKSSSEDQAACDHDAVGIQGRAGTFYPLLRGVVKRSLGANEIASNLRPHQADLALSGELP